MKKIIFALPVLALSLLFTFCNKTDVQETTASPDSGTGVISRAPCTFRVYSDNVHDITFCGTLTNKTNCVGCGVVSANGVETAVGNGMTVTVNSNIFYVTTSSPGGSWINLVEVNGVDQTGFVYIPAGGCLTVTMDNNCNFL